MPDSLSQALAFDGLAWLAFAAFFAGAVRGFTGFGTALVFMPIAGQFMSPIWAIVTLTAMESIGPLPNVIPAWRRADLRQVGLLALACAIALPMGLILLTRMDASLFQIIVCGLAILVPLILLTGWRYRGAVSAPVLLGIGGMSGFMSGIAGLGGPPAILFYMSSDQPAARIRANIMLFLFAVEFLMIAALWLAGHLDLVPIAIGLVLIVPNMLGNLAGAAMFRPDKERLYRMVGYTAMITVGLTGLPLWG